MGYKIYYKEKWKKRSESYDNKTYATKEAAKKALDRYKKKFGSNYNAKGNATVNIKPAYSNKKKATSSRGWWDTGF